MKKLSLIVFIANIVLAKAQISFPYKGADWHYGVVLDGSLVNPGHTNVEIKYIKDTLFLGRNVALMGNIDNFFYYQNERSNTYIYTSNDTVYFYNATTQNKWQVLYNFNCTAGQSWQIHFQEQYSSEPDTTCIMVDSVKYTSINGTSLKTLYVKYTFFKDTEKFSYPSIIYDRIGDTKYLLDFWTKYYFVLDFPSQYTGLLCYQDSSLALYQSDSTKGCYYYSTGIQQFKEQNDVSIYPNPSSGSVNIESTNDINNLIIRNLLGQIIYEAKPNASNITITLNNEGVYFVTSTTDKGRITKKIIIE